MTVIDQAPGSLRGDDRTYNDYRRAGIRLTEEIDPLLAQAQSGATNLFAKGLQWFDKAHLVMLAEEGIIPRNAAVQCLRALRELDKDNEKVRIDRRLGLHGGEAYLIRSLGMEVGGYIHAGRSSWDLTRVSHRVRLRDELLKVLEALNEYRRALLDLSAANVETVMSYYTHGQQGQPSTFGHHLHAFACAAERDFQRLDLACAHMNISPAGAAAGTATRFPTNRERVSALLGFDTVSVNTRDSSYNYDHLWEMAAALSAAAASLGFLADEIILWMSNEFRLVQLADRYCHTSSIMTHKRNPTAAEHIQGVRSSITGRTPTSYTPAELVRASEQLAISFKLMAGMLSTLRVDKDEMLRGARESWAQASDLAGTIVEETGLPWRMAHQIVGIMVRLAEEDGVPPGHPAPELLDRAAVLFLGRPLGLSAASIERAMDPAQCVLRRTAAGSPGPDGTRREAEASRRTLADDEARLKGRHQGLAAAESQLERAIDALVGG